MTKKKVNILSLSCRDCNGSGTDRAGNDCKHCENGRVLPQVAIVSNTASLELIKIAAPAQ